MININIIFQILYSLIIQLQSMHDTFDKSIILNF